MIRQSYDHPIFIIGSPYLQDCLYTEQEPGGFFPDRPGIDPVTEALYPRHRIFHWIVNKEFVTEIYSEFISLPVYDLI